MFTPTRCNVVEACALRIELELDVALQIHSRKVDCKINLAKARKLLKDSERQALEVVRINVRHAQRPGRDTRDHGFDSLCTRTWKRSCGCADGRKPLFARLRTRAIQITNQDIGARCASFVEAA